MVAASYHLWGDLTVLPPASGTKQQGIMCFPPWQHGWGMARPALHRDNSPVKRHLARHRAQVGTPYAVRIAGRSTQHNASPAPYAQISPPPARTAPKISLAMRFNPRTGYSQRRKDMTYCPTLTVRPRVPLRRKPAPTEPA
ncbi:hypothetical protein predicted by Glimmer/Critica [Acetobacter ghanensis]|uniref:Uncharacterized protein n=1 Tax=Acetobacter ghanensis TaxID=431306 RepID=A0A0U5F6D2_9PROT|nr:hypothetical protein predicted by Glimmer/Critica [Acetobacter ghanensis]